MSKILDYFILSLVITIMFFHYGYVFTSGSMICLYATVYALMEERKDS